LFYARPLSGDPAHDIKSAVTKGRLVAIAPTATANMVVCCSEQRGCRECGRIIKRFLDPFHPRYTCRPQDWQRVHHGSITDGSFFGAAVIFVGYRTFQHGMALIQAYCSGPGGSDQPAPHPLQRTRYPVALSSSTLDLRSAAFSDQDLRQASGLFVDFGEMRSVVA